MLETIINILYYCGIATISFVVFWFFLFLWLAYRDDFGDINGRKL